MVPLYDTLGPDSISYVINHSEITSCFCCISSLKTLLKTENIGKLKNIVCFDDIPNEEKEKATAK